MLCVICIVNNTKNWIKIELLSSCRQEKFHIFKSYLENIQEYSMASMKI